MAEKLTYEQLLNRVKELEETERLYRSLADNTSDLLYRTDAQGRIIYLSSSVYELSGYTQEEALGMNMAEDVYLIPEQRQVFLSQLQQEGHVKNFVAQLKRKDGSVWWGMANAHYYHDAQGNIAGVEGITRDITEQRQAMQTILDQKILAQKYLDIAGVMFATLNLEGEITLMNRKGHQILGYQEGELVGENWFDVCLPETIRLKIKEIFRQQMSGDYKPLNFYENSVLTRSGDERIIAFNNTLLHDETGICGVLFSGEDITDRKEAEEKLRLSEEKFRTAFQTSPDAINLNRLADGAYVEINDSFTRIMGYTVADVTGKSSLALNIWKDQSVREKLVRQIATNGSVENLEAEFIAKDGSIKQGLMSARTIEVSGELLIMSITRDITERKEIEKESAILNFAMKQINELGFLVDKSSHFKYVNDASCTALGYSKKELLRMKITDIDANFQEEKWPEHWQALQEKGTRTFETSLIRKDGSSFPIEITTNYLEYNDIGYIFALALDITERKHDEKERLKLEKQMVQTQKLESLGVLAGGIAHDFNNLLAVIMGHSELAKRRLPPETPAVENLTQIEKSTERAADLAKQMLAYSGKGKFIVEPIELNLMLEEMLHMLQVSISKNVLLRLNPCSALPAVNADATQIRQIIMNLVINAAEAIGEKNGVVSISTGCIDCDQNDLRDVWLNENLAAGRYVYLEISDTGCGMSKETQTKIFDPFFTTKFTGRGLGMSAVLGIVRGHKGAIKVYSEPGKGSTFKILLPASKKNAELFKVDSPKDEWEGTGKILLVDDEESVREIGKEMLKELGFSPMTANDGLEALEMFQDNPDIFLVILDLTMPRMGGEQCFQELKKLSPDVKVIISSGYNESEVTQKFIAKGIAGFVQKPYRLSTLRDAIKKSLTE